MTKKQRVYNKRLAEYFRNKRLRMEYTPHIYKRDDYIYLIKLKIYFTKNDIQSFLDVMKGYLHFFLLKNSAFFDQYQEIKHLMPNTTWLYFIHVYTIAYYLITHMNSIKYEDREEFFFYSNVSLNTDRAFDFSRIIPFVRSYYKELHLDLEYDENFDFSILKSKKAISPENLLFEDNILQDNINMFLDIHDLGYDIVEKACDIINKGVLISNNILSINESYIVNKILESEKRYE